MIQSNNEIAVKLASSVIEAIYATQEPMCLTKGKVNISQGQAQEFVTATILSRLEEMNPAPTTPNESRLEAIIDATQIATGNHDVGLDLLNFFYSIRTLRKYVGKELRFSNVNMNDLFSLAKSEVDALVNDYKNAQ